MDSKTKAEFDKLEKKFKKQLIALALVAGYDWAIRTLTEERAGIIAEMTRALSPKVSHRALPKPKAVHRALPKPKVAIKDVAVEVARTKPVFGALDVLDASKGRLLTPKLSTFSPFAMRSALKNILAHGPQPIRKIAEELKDKGVTKDTSPETKRAICAYLGRDKTFSVKKRGIYRLRTKT